jgi:hypothetical protein
MRGAAHYYLAQTWRPRGHRQAQQGPAQIQQGTGRPRAAYQARHARADAPVSAPRSRPVRELPAVARRVLAVLSGTS